MAETWKQIGALLIVALRQLVGQDELKEQLVELREEVAALWEPDGAKTEAPGIPFDALADKLDALDQRLARLEEAGDEEAAAPESPQPPQRKTRAKKGEKTHTDLVLDDLDREGEPQLTANIAERIGLTKTQVGNALAKLRREGLVVSGPLPNAGNSRAKLWERTTAQPSTEKRQPQTPKVIPMPPRPRRENELEEAVLDHLRGCPAPVSIESISEAVDIPAKKVGEIVEGLADEMLVESDRRGVRLSRMTDEDWKLIRILKADGRALPAMEIAQRTHLPLAKAIERLEALEEDGRVEKRGEKWRLGGVS